MKKTLIALLALSGIAGAQVVVYDFNNSSTSPSYGTYEDVAFIQSGSFDNDGMTTGKSVTLNEKSITIKSQAGTAFDRNFNTAANENWSAGNLPSVVDNLGLTDATLSTLCSSSIAVYGSSNNISFPGIISVEISGLGKGTYEFSALSARTSGTMAPTTWSITLGATEWTASDYANNSSYYIYNSTSLKWDKKTGQPITAKSTTGNAVYSVFKVNVATDNTTLRLTLGGVDGTAAADNANKALQFVALKSIPEPTTATLSLLALAGLAARRRRK